MSAEIYYVIAGSVLVISVVVGIFKLGEWKGRVDASPGTLKGSVDANLKTLQDLVKWKGSVDTNLETLKELAKEIRNDIKRICERLPDPPISGSSPPRLTELGKKISAEIKGREWARKQADGLVSLVRGKEPYEVYEICDNFVRNEYRFTAEEERLLKSSGYEHTTEHEKVLGVLVVELRDRLFELRDKALDDK